MSTPSHLRLSLQISRSFSASHSFIVASCVKGLGLEVETLEEPLYVNSSLGTRVSVDKICQDCELEISRILLTVDVTPQKYPRIFIIILL